MQMVPEPEQSNSRKNYLSLPIMLTSLAKATIATVGKVFLPITISTRKSPMRSVIYQFCDNRATVQAGVALPQKLVG